MGDARGILQIGLGVGARALSRPANAALPRIAPAPRRIAARVAVGWTFRLGTVKPTSRREPRLA